MQERAQPYLQSMSLSRLPTCSLQPLVPSRKQESRENPARRGQLGGRSLLCPRSPSSLPFPELCTGPHAACRLGWERDVFWLWGNVISSSCRAKNQRQRGVFEPTSWEVGWGVGAKLAAICCQRMAAPFLPWVPLLQDSSDIVSRDRRSPNLTGFPRTAQCKCGRLWLRATGSSAGRWRAGGARQCGKHLSRTKPRPGSQCCGLAGNALAVSARHAAISYCQRCVKDFMNGSENGIYCGLCAQVLSEGK